jgi:hypothetical protein
VTFASNQNSVSIPLSVTSQRILELREGVLAEWQKKARETITQASFLPDRF